MTTARGAGGMHQKQGQADLAEEVKDGDRPAVFLWGLLGSMALFGLAGIAGVWTGDWQWWPTGAFAAVLAFAGGLFAADGDVRSDRGVRGMVVACMAAASALVMGFLLWMWTSEWLWMLTGLLGMLVAPVVGMVTRPAPDGKHAQGE